jgi:hypothetical protein
VDYGIWPAAPGAPGFGALGDDPADRGQARVQLGELADGGDTDALNFLGILAWRGGARDEARACWARSRDALDIAAPLLLRIGSLA